MKRLNFVLDIITEYHYTECVNFLKDFYNRSDEEIKLLIVKKLYSSSMLDNIDAHYLEDIYSDAKDENLKVWILKVFSKKDKKIFRTIFLKEYKNIKWTDELITLIIDDLEGKEFLRINLSFLKTKDLYLKAKIFEKISATGADEIYELIKTTMKKGNDLLQLSIIKGFKGDRFFEFAISKSFSNNPTIQIACLAKFSDMLVSDEISIQIKKSILNVIYEKLDSEEEIVKLSAIKSVSFFDKRIFLKLMTMWEKLHPFYFPVLRESIINMLIMDKSGAAEKILRESLNIFKIKNFVNFLNKINNKELLLFIFKNFKRKDDFDVFASKIHDFLFENKIFLDQRFLLSFFKDLDDTEILYFRGILEKIFTRDFVPFRFRDIDVKIISEYLDIFGILSLEYSRHFNYVNYDYVKISVLKFIEKNEDNFSFLVECAKYKSEDVRKAAIFSLGEFESASNFLIGLYKKAGEFQKMSVIKALSLGRSEIRKNFFIKEIQSTNLRIEIFREILNAFSSYTQDEVVIAICRNGILNYSDLSSKIICLKNLIMSNNYTQDFLSVVLENESISNNKELFIELCECIKFFNKEKAVELYFVLMEHYPEWHTVISKYMYYFRDIETARKIILYAESTLSV